jgi:hypothetical protein
MSCSHVSLSISYLDEDKVTWWYECNHCAKGFYITPSK